MTFFAFIRFLKSYMQNAVFCPFFRIFRHTYTQRAHFPPYIGPIIVRDFFQIRKSFFSGQKQEESKSFFRMNISEELRGIKEKLEKFLEEISEQKHRLKIKN